MSRPGGLPPGLTARENLLGQMHFAAKGPQARLVHEILPNCFDGHPPPQLPVFGLAT